MKREFLVKVAAVIGLFCFFGSSANAQQQTVLFPCLGFPQFFGVPADVTQITAEIVGSDGNQLEELGLSTGRGGKGAKLTATIAVTPGEILTVDSGCKTGYGFTRGGRAQAFDRDNFRRFFWSGFTGGGSSAIVNQSTVLAVAGGGGSSGSVGRFDIRGGRGGDAILATGNGGNGDGASPGTGGAFGGASTGDGTDGTIISQSARSGGGGGGGGGYDPNGGGGGTGGSGGEPGGGGGGGGGRSYTNPAFVSAVTHELFPGEETENGYVRITYNGASNGHRLERCTGQPTTYTVPNRVRRLIVSGIGGDGGGQSLKNHNFFLSPVLGGTGDNEYTNISGTSNGYRAEISVVPGEQFTLAVGCKGGRSTIGAPLDSINPGGAGGFGFIPGGRGGDGDKPQLLADYGIGGLGGGGASGIARGPNPLFVAAGGGGGGGVGGAYNFGCYSGEGGVAEGRNGGDASPCANNGRGGLTGGSFSVGGNACSFCTSGGGGGGGGGYPSGRGGTAGGIGSSGGGGGGGGRHYATGSAIEFESLQYRRTTFSMSSFPFHQLYIYGIHYDSGEVLQSQDGVLSITPVYTDLAPPVITPLVIPSEPNGNNGWYRTDVTISWQVNSDLPITSQTGCTTSVVTTDTSSFTSNCSVTNAVGTASGSAPTIKRDATQPNITATAIDQNGVPYTFGTPTSVPVTVTFSCSDAMSGVASCPAAQTFGSSTAVIGRATDNAGNTRIVNFGNVVSDNQPPTISPIGNVQTPVNTTIASVPFTVNDAETQPAQLVVRFSSSNENVVSNGLISLLTNPQNPNFRALEIIPVSNKVGTTIITVQVFDARSAKAETTFVVSVRCGTITIQQPPSVMYGAFLDAQLFPSGGVEPYTFVPTSGILPDGLQFDSEFNRLVGGPVAAFAPSTRNLQYRVTDANGCSNPVPVTVNVACLPNPSVTQATDSTVFSLRGLVAGACPNSTITFDGFLQNQELSIFGAIDIQKPLTIQGLGADKLTLKNVNPPGNNSNVLTVGPINGDTTISGLTIKDGTAPNSFGGGIRSSANLTVKDSVITNNSASRGGGIGSTQSLTVINTTVSNNFAFNSNDFNGGGILSNGPLNLINSTVSGNAMFGRFNSAAGVYAARGLISNSTITNNRVDDAFPSVNMASGVFGGSANLIVRSSIIAGNQNNGVFPDVRNLFTSTGFNLIGNSGSVTAFNQPTDQTGSNPMLAPLGLNGGTVPTHAFASIFSPALDRGFAFGLTTDQRGVARIVDLLSVPNVPTGDGTDIGAFELQAPTAANASISGRILTAEGHGIRNVRVTLTDQTGSSRTVVSSSFGWFQFTDVEAGRTYVLSISSRRFTFAQPARVVSVDGDLVDLNFTADPM